MVIMMKAPCKCGEWERVTLRHGVTKTGEYFYVFCPRCGRKGFEENSREEAVKVWNRKMSVGKEELPGQMNMNDLEIG